MKKIQILSFFIIVVVFSFIYTGCSARSNIATAKSGAQLWGENCLRCHNTPSPKTFSDAEWDAAVLHMRVRANLTASEATKIVEFLKTAN